MSVTFSGAFTFSGGGFTATLAPPPTPTAGWIAGGTPGYSTVQRITFATDTATASVRGPLAYSVFEGAGVGTLTDGWFGGGYSGGVSSKINRITYATDTATATSRGPLSLAKAMGGTGATGNSTYGWFNGGKPPTRSSVDRITYSNDTTTASSRGPLSAARYGLASVGTEDYGWCAAGFTTLVDRIDYANDTATASVRGPLNAATYNIAGSSDGTTYGWVAGGNPGGSTVQRITYANDTATASIRGQLSVGRNSMQAVGDSTYGWFTGGNPITSIVSRITYSNDTAIATTTGPLAQTTYAAGAASGVQ
jgi:hypothetical protein